MNNTLKFYHNFIKNHKFSSIIVELNINWKIIFFHDLIIKNESKPYEISLYTLILNINPSFYFHICHFESQIIKSINNYYSKNIIKNLKIFTSI